MKYLRRWLLVPCLIALSLWLWHAVANLEKTELDDAYRDARGLSYTELSHGAVHYVIDAPESQSKANDAALSTNWVVLVHGFSTPSYIWQSSSAALAEAGYSVLRFDLYGRGFSDRPVLDYTIDLFVEQLNELLARLEIHTPVHLVGLSMGGPISTRFSHQFPEKVTSLSLLAPLVETPERLDLQVLAVPGIGEYVSTVIMMPTIRNGHENSLYSTAAYPQWHALMDQHIHLRGYRQALLSTLRYLKGKSFEHDYRLLATSGIPTQLIWGENDQVVPLHQSDVIRRAYPGTVLHRLAQTGHLPQIEQTDQVTRLLLAHFKSALSSPALQ